MTDLQYDTRTGAVMAGGSMAAPVSKKMFATLREASDEAKNKSNQELTLLLTHYNHQLEDVIEAFKTGDADVVLGGWATTATKKSKGKKNKQGGGDSDGTPTETGSVASNAKVQPVASKQIQPASNPPANNKQGSNSQQNQQQQQQQQPPQQNGTSSKQQSQPQAKNSAATSGGSGNQQNQSQPSNNQESRPEKPSSKNQKTKKNDTLNPRDVTVPDIHTHASSFNKLMQESASTYQHDVTNLDSVFGQLQTSLNERYNWLRRTLDLNHQESQSLLAERMNLAVNLSEKIAQSTAMGPQEYNDWQQNVTRFVSDYKFDVHIAESPKFTYAFDEILNDLNDFGHVVSTLPSYSYKPQANRPPAEAAPSRNSQSSNRGMTNGNVQSNNNNANNTNKPQSRNTTNSNNNTNQSNQRNNNNNTQQPPRQNSFQSQTQLLPVHERVTIVPNGLPTSSSAPLNSLVISGSNLTPEELAALTQSLQSTLGFPGSNSNQGMNGGGGGGSSNFPAELFAGGAVWTNSNASSQGQQNWQSPNVEGSSGFQGQGQTQGQDSQYSNQNSGGNNSSTFNYNNGNYSQNNGGQSRGGGGSGGASRGRGNNSRGGSRGGRGGRPARGGPGATRN